MGYQGDERRSQSESWLDSLPIWVRALGVIGIPGAIAVFLVWIFAQDVPRISRLVEANTTELDAQRELLKAQQIKTDETFRLLQRICNNTAKTEEERQRCFDR